MELTTFWFILLGVLWTGYFFLEGFDFGVGMLLHPLGRTETDRRVLINTIGPVWDGNEVWLLTAGGATFAAFPNWYATLFSGFYLALFLILVALILLELPARKGAEPGAGGMRSRFDEVSVSVRRFVALTGLIGVGLAVVNLVAMLALGTDFPMVWAVLLFLLNFVPFGFAIGMLPPLAVTLLEHGVSRAAILLGVLVVSNLLSDNVVKPKLMGSGFGLSPLLIVVSLMFWAFVLGPVGAILAVPLTITITTLAPFFAGEVRPAE